MKSVSCFSDEVNVYEELEETTVKCLSIGESSESDVSSQRTQRCAAIIITMNTNIEHPICDEKLFEH